MPIDLMREGMHHYISVNPRKIGCNRAFSPPTAASVIYPSLSTFLSLSLSLCYPSIFFQLPALSIHKSIIIISMVTDCILHWLWPIVRYNSMPRAVFKAGRRRTQIWMVSQHRTAHVYHLQKSQLQRRCCQIVTMEPIQQRFLLVSIGSMHALLL